MSHILQPLLDGMREGYEMAKTCHEIDPVKFTAERLEFLKKSIDEVERRMKSGATAPRPAKVVAAVNKYDPIKEKADRAEERSVRTRVSAR